MNGVEVVTKSEVDTFYDNLQTHFEFIDTKLEEIIFYLHEKCINQDHKVVFVVELT